MSDEEVDGANLRTPSKLKRRMIRSADEDEDALDDNTETDLAEMSFELDDSPLDMDSHSKFECNSIPQIVAVEDLFEELPTALPEKHDWSQLFLTSQQLEQCGDNQVCCFAAQIDICTCKMRTKPL